MTLVTLSTKKVRENFLFLLTFTLFYYIIIIGGKIFQNDTLVLSTPLIEKVFPKL